MQCLLLCQLNIKHVYENIWEDASVFKVIFGVRQFMVQLTPRDSLIQLGEEGEKEKQNGRMAML